MTTLTEFLLARIAEDEEVLRPFIGPGGRPPHEWRSEESGGRVLVWSEIERGDDLVVNASTHLDAMHIARHDPARVLAECEAKRRIVALHDQWHECTFGPGVEAAGAVQEEEACPTLRLLALPYADHEDFRDEWRP